MGYLVKDLLTLREKEITSSEYGLIMSHLEDLKRFSCEIDYYKIVETSINEYLLLQNRIQTDSYDDFVILNSRFSNWLNAFYMWKQYHKKIYASDIYGLIEQCKNENIYFNLTWELRNYVIHDAFAISTICFDVLNENTTYLIEPSDIFSKKYNSQLKKWLNDKVSADEKIDSVECIMLFNKVFNDLQNKIWNELLPDILLRINECLGVLKIEDADIKNIVIEDGETSCMAGHILDGIKGKMQHVITRVNIE